MNGRALGSSNGKALGVRGLGFSNGKALGVRDYLKPNAYSLEPKA